MHISLLAFVNLIVLPFLVAGQLAGKVGPTTTLAQKRAKKTCDITKYGARPGKAGDIGPALSQAFAACKSGGNIVIPQGDWGLATWVNMNGGSGWALQWDGTIHRVGKAGGNMLLINGARDVEVYSSTGTGAFQGNGYEYHRNKDIKGPRILRVVKTTDFAVHDLLWADCPSFFLVMDGCKNGEVYNMAIAGSYQGGIDGIDVFSDNIWIHDIMVSNKDECVCVKSPSHNILIENIYCNWSGGSAIGSLGANVDVSDVIFRNVYTIKSNQMMMIKSWGGSGTLTNVLFENFIGYSNAYSLNIDQYWSPMKQVAGPGVAVSNVTFKGWRGTAENASNRPLIKVLCADGAPCKNIDIEDFAMWTDAGNTATTQCRSAYGTGGCLKEGAGGPYPMVKGTIAKPAAGYSAAKMPFDRRASTGTNQPIPIPEMPDYFFPGTKPIKPLVKAGSGGVVVPPAPSVGSSVSGPGPTAVIPGGVVGIGAPKQGGILTPTASAGVGGVAPVASTPAPAATPSSTSSSLSGLAALLSALKGKSGGGVKSSDIGAYWADRFSGPRRRQASGVFPTIVPNSNSTKPRIAGTAGEAMAASAPKMWPGGTGHGTGGPPPRD